MAVMEPPIPDTICIQQGPPNRPDSIWDVRERLEENFRRVERLLTEMEMQQVPKMRLAAAAEMRQHIALAEKTLETAARAEAVRAFEEIVLTVLSEASAKVLRRVLEALKARGAHGNDHAVPDVTLSEDRGEVRQRDLGRQDAELSEQSGELCG